MNNEARPEYRENPSPRQAYRLTMTIKDAPGPLKIIASAAQYDVVNRECLPPPKDNPGGRSSPVPTRDIPFELAQVSDGVYVGTVYADAMIDEDYHGRGVCRWELIQARAHLKATGADGETRFIAGLSQSEGEFQSGQPKTTYFWKGGYPASKIEDFPDFGEPEVDRFKFDIRNELFTIALASEEVAP
ncbi:hypothetical protein E2F46_12990 [Luteimonas aestuarii]|uniref:Uncharacterized protein n=1 Tax=Luteimonas aestuarii TaxID=453837 RepID=A0A4R5TRB3_9GAMM|nr:hypothetical protein [Luteimonas aestuarii]TDK22677.1 hypothetical protein E2F46_12990 [Luteimonas aestuarii]